MTLTAKSTQIEDRGIFGVYEKQITRKLRINPDGTITYFVYWSGVLINCASDGINSKWSAQLLADFGLI